MTTKKQNENLLNEEEVRSEEVSTEQNIEQTEETPSENKTQEEETADTTAESDVDADDDSAEEKESGKKKGKKNKKEKKVDPKEAEIAELKEKLAESNNKYLRLTAEFDNYRKRTLKEKSDIIKTAAGDVLKDILTVVDDFERGLESMEKAEDVAAVKEGVSLIYNKFNDFLKNKGIKEIEAKGQEFDTDLHEALTKIPAPEENLKGKVVDVIQKGYIIEDKVIRFAKVVIGE